MRVVGTSEHLFDAIGSEEEFMNSCGCWQVAT